MMIYSKNINQAFFKISTTNDCKDIKKKVNAKRSHFYPIFFFTEVLLIDI